MSSESEHFESAVLQKVFLQMLAGLFQDPVNVATVVPGAQMFPQVFPGAHFFLDAQMFPQIFPGAQMVPRIFPGAQMVPRIFPGAQMVPRIFPGAQIFPQIFSRQAELSDGV